MGLTSANGRGVPGIGFMRAATGEQVTVACGPLVAEHVREGASCPARRSDRTSLTIHSHLEHYP